VCKIIAEIHKRGTTVLLVVQNARMALGVSSGAGRLAFGGDPTTLWSDKRIRDAYLGGGQLRAPT